MGFLPAPAKRLQERATRHEPKSKKVRMRKLLWNQLTLPGQLLSQEDEAMNLRLIREFQPRILWGYTSALTGLAEHIRRVPEAAPTYPVGLVTTWAGPLYAHEKKLLEDVFQCPITNIYGSREVGHIASTCPSGRLHVNQEYFYLESIPVGPPDSAAELLVTLLAPGPMPFIRYQIGDLGEISDDRCPCRRSLQTIKALLGRTTELYTTEDGRQIPLNFWTGTFGEHLMCQSIERFQIVYRHDRSISIRIVRRENYSAEVEAAIWKHLREAFPAETRFEFEYPCRINPRPSGKYQLIVTESDS